MTDYLIYGVDGMSKPVVNMMASNGNLPQINELRQRKRTVDGEWESHVSESSPLNVPRTGPAWNSIYTGLKPEGENGHGYTLDGWEEGDSKFHQTYTVWDKLSEEGVEIGLFDMPMTYRAKEINGWMMSGFVATTLKSMFDNLLYPPDLIEDNDFIENTPTYIAKAEFGGIAPEQTEDGLDTMENAEDFVDRMAEAEDRKVEKFREIYEERGGDVVAYGTTFADKVGHADGVNPTNELTRKTYKKVDEVLGKLIQIVEPDEVVIISDHGFSGWSHDLYGYYLNTAGEELEDIFDFTPFLLSEYGVVYEPEEYGVKGRLGDDLMEEEKEDIRGQLRDLGYDVDSESES